MIKIINEMILSKISDKGLRIAYWISSVLLKVFFINLLIGVIMNLYVYGVNIYYGKMNSFMPYNGFMNFILNFILPMFVSIAPFILIRLITKLIGEKVKVEFDQSGVLFATGLFLILINIEGVLGIINSIGTIIYRMQLDAEIGVFGYVNPIVNIIIPIVYILIGLKYVKMSNYLKDKNSIDQIEEIQ